MFPSIIVKRIIRVRIGKVKRKFRQLRHNLKRRERYCVRSERQQGGGLRETAGI